MSAPALATICVINQSDQTIFTITLNDPKHLPMLLYLIFEISFSSMSPEIILDIQRRNPQHMNRLLESFKCDKDPSNKWNRLKSILVRIEQLTKDLRKDIIQVCGLLKDIEEAKKIIENYGIKMVDKKPLKAEQGQFPFGWLTIKIDGRKNYVQLSLPDYLMKESLPLEKSIEQRNDDCSFVKHEVTMEEAAPPPPPPSQQSVSTLKYSQAIHTNSIPEYTEVNELSIPKLERQLQQPSLNNTLSSNGEQQEPINVVSVERIQQNNIESQIGKNESSSINYSVDTRTLEQIGNQLPLNCEIKLTQSVFASHDNSQGSCHEPPFNNSHQVVPNLSNHSPKKQLQRTNSSVSEKSPSKTEIKSPSNESLKDEKSSPSQKKRSPRREKPLSLQLQSKNSQPNLIEQIPASRKAIAYKAGGLMDQLSEALSPTKSQTTIQKPQAASTSQQVSDLLHEASQVSPIEKERTRSQRICGIEFGQEQQQEITWSISEQTDKLNKANAEINGVKEVIQGLQINPPSQIDPNCNQGQLQTSHYHPHTHTQYKHQQYSYQAQPDSTHQGKPDYVNQSGQPNNAHQGQPPYAIHQSQPTYTQQRKPYYTQVQPGSSHQNQPANASNQGQPSNESNQLNLNEILDGSSLSDTNLEHFSLTSQPINRKKLIKPLFCVGGQWGQNYNEQANYGNQTYPSHPKSGQTNQQMNSNQPTAETSTHVHVVPGIVDSIILPPVPERPPSAGPSDNIPPEPLDSSQSEPNRDSQKKNNKDDQTDKQSSNKTNSQIKYSQTHKKSPKQKPPRTVNQQPQQSYQGNERQSHSQPIPLIYTPKVQQSGPTYWDTVVLGTILALLVLACQGGVIQWGLNPL